MWPTLILVIRNSVGFRKLLRPTTIGLSSAVIVIIKKQTYR